jgi:carboxyl-terminal processing protease
VITSLLRSLSASVLVVFVLLLPFVSGYVVGHSDAASPPRALLDNWLTRARLLAPRDRDLAPPPPADADEAFKPLWEAVGYVNQEFFDEQAITQEKLARGAMRGMLGALDDPYTLYLDPTHRQVTESDLRGAFEGIGVQVEIVDERLTVIAPLEGSPGEKAGLRTSDVITRVDGRDIRGLGLAEAIGLIRGPRGTTVTLMVQRESAAPFEVAIQRDEIRTSAVRSEVKDGVGYIRISTFSQRVGADVRAAVDRIKDQAIRGWVLDLRGNPGGYLDGAVSVTSQFVSDSVVLYEQGRGDVRTETRTRGSAPASERPMAVLVDRGSASASEIVAAALRDNGRASLVGETTFGKGSVQKVHALSDGSAIRITVAAWLTPKGERIHGTGLSPDIPVATVAGSDVVLEQALNVVRTQSTSAGALGQPAAMATAQTSGDPVGRPRVSELIPDAAPVDEDVSVGVLDSQERLSLRPVGEV